MAMCTTHGSGFLSMHLARSRRRWPPVGPSHEATVDVSYRASSCSPIRENMARAGSISMSQASKAMMQKQRFKQTLSELRMSFQQFAKLWPDFVVKGSGKDMRLSLTAPIPRRTTGTLDDIAQ